MKTNDFSLRVSLSLTIAECAVLDGLLETLERAGEGKPMNQRELLDVMLALGKLGIPDLRRRILAAMDRAEAIEAATKAETF